MEFFSAVVIDENYTFSLQVSHKQVLAVYQNAKMATDKIEYIGGKQTRHVHDVAFLIPLVPLAGPPGLCRKLISMDGHELCYSEILA